jgi:hypothetical protein
VSEPCRRSANPMLVNGACDECGHSSGLHHGIPNTTLDACLACVVLRHVASHGHDTQESW